MVAYTRKKLYHAVKVVLIRSAGQQEPLEKTGYERKKKVAKKNCARFGNRKYLLLSLPRFPQKVRSSRG